MLEIFFTGLDNFILLRCMGWDDGWEYWRSIFCFFLTIKLFCLYFSPTTYSLGVYSVQCKDPGDLGSFWPNWAWLTDTFLKWSIGPVSNILEEAWAIVSHNYAFTFPGLPLKASGINNICHQKLFYLQFLWLHSACSWQRKSFSS